MTIRLIHVAVAVIRDAAGRVLCTQRLPHQHLAGLWEFPGGKLEPGESLADGLRREIHEELGIVAGRLAPLLRVEHRYPEKSVLLDIWRVLDWTGEPHGREGQPLRWQHPDQMRADEFPPADVPIIAALRLPLRYFITPELTDFAACEHYAAQVRDADARLLQIRLKQRPELALSLLAELRVAVPAARILVNSDTLAMIDPAAAEQFDGVHQTAQQLRERSSAPLAGLRAASCHDANELAQAFVLGLDFVTVSPVLATRSHPDSQALGWARFAELAAAAGLPVYALGGMAAGDQETALAQGAVGIAGISGLL